MHSRRDGIFRRFWLTATPSHERFIREEVLAVELVPRMPGGETVEEWTFDGERARVGIERVHEGG